MKIRTIEEATKLVQILKSDDACRIKCPVCRNKPLIRCFPDSHNTKLDEYGFCLGCDEEGWTM